MRFISTVHKHVTTQELEVWKYCTLCGSVFKTTFLKKHEMNHTKLWIFIKCFLPLNDIQKKNPNPNPNGPQKPQQQTALFCLLKSVFWGATALASVSIVVVQMDLQIIGLSARVVTASSFYGSSIQDKRLILTCRTHTKFGIFTSTNCVWLLPDVSYFVVPQVMTKDKRQFAIWTTNRNMKLHVYRLQLF